jgi:hypothetical protein
MDRLLRLVGLALAGIGILACVPFVRAVAEMERATAQILEVVLTPVGEDHRRISVAFLFPVKGDARVEQLAWGQGDGFFRPGEEPVLPAAEAEALREAITAHPYAQVWYRANDPAGTAFILAVDQERPWRRYVLGGLAASVGLFLLLRRRAA